MKDKNKKQPAKKTKTSRENAVQPKESRNKYAIVKEGFRAAGTDIGLDILGMIDALPFYVILVDEHHHIIEANEAVRKHLGLKPKDIVGKYCPKVIHGLDEPFFACPLEEAVEKDQAIEREIFDTESGRWISSAIYPTRNLTPDGRRIFFHMVVDITDEKQTREQLQASRDQLRSLSAHLESVIEQERKRIARELHDETSQTLASITARLEAAASMLPPSLSKPESIIRKVQFLSVNLLDGIHRLIYELRPALLDDFGLVAATKWLAKYSLETAGIAVNYKTVGRPRRLTSQLETTLFRVIQEAFTNTAKYSHAKNTEVSLHFKKRVAMVHIRDDGMGFDVKDAINSKDRPRGLGLLGMRERVELMNGTLNIRSGPGVGGTEITIEVPLNYEGSSG